MSFITSSNLLSSGRRSTNLRSVICLVMRSSQGRYIISNTDRD